MTFDEFHKGFGQLSTFLVLACSKTCETCIEWNKPGNVWKNFVFSPLHCHLCEFVGYEEDYDLFGSGELKLFLCQNCFNSCKNKAKRVLKREFIM